MSVLSECAVYLSGGEIVKPQTCKECGAPKTWGPIWGTWICRDCVQRKYEAAERANSPERASGNDTHALPPRGDK